MFSHKEYSAHLAWPQSKDTSQKFGHTFLLLTHTLYNSKIVVIILILIRIISIYLIIQFSIHLFIYSFILDFDTRLFVNSLKFEQHYH